MNYSKSELLHIGIEAGQIPRYLYTYISTASAKKFLENSKLWMSSFDKFNDPFEFSFSLNNDYTEEEFIQWYLNANRKGNRMTAQKVFSDKEEVDNIVKSAIENVLSNYGIKCFTKSPDNLLMWAHYADDHKGVCFKFDVLKSADFFQDLLSVKYDNTYIQLNYIKSPKDTIEVLRHKGDVWKYENEWRILKQGKANTLVDISPESLVEIILGCRCTAREEIQQLCSLKGFKFVQFSQAQMARDTYSLIIEGG